MNLQRTVIYKRRKNALDFNRLKVDIANMIYETVDSIFSNSKENNDFKSFEFDLIRYFSVTSPISIDDFEKGDEIKCIEKTYQLVLEYYEKKTKKMPPRYFYS